MCRGGWRGKLCGYRCGGWRGCGVAVAIAAAVVWQHGRGGGWWCVAHRWRACAALAAHSMAACAVATKTAIASTGAAATRATPHSMCGSMTAQARLNCRNTSAAHTSAGELAVRGARLCARGPHTLTQPATRLVAWNRMRHHRGGTAQRSASTRVVSRHPNTARRRHTCHTPTQTHHGPHGHNN